MVIYKYTNRINGKVYVGKTTRPDPKTRHLEHLADSREATPSMYFHKALKKYGETNFDYEIVDGANASDELAYKEEFYIHKYDCLSPKGYNQILGKTFPIPLRIKISEKSSNARKILATEVSTGEVKEYRSVLECERKLELPRNTVYEMLNGKREYSERAGHLFTYADQAPIKKKIKIRKETPVRRICNKSQEVKLYSGANETEQDGFSAKHVLNACMKRRKISGYQRNRKVGYRWEFVDG